MSGRPRTDVTSFCEPNRREPPAARSTPTIMTRSWNDVPHGTFERVERKHCTTRATRRRVALQRASNPGAVDFGRRVLAQPTHMFRQQRCRGDAQRAGVSREARVHDYGIDDTELDSYTVA